MLQTVSWAQIYSFDIDEFLASLPRPDGVKVETFKAGAEQLLTHVIQLAGNTGQTDGERAVNYLILRYPALHSAVAEHHAANSSLSSVEVRAAPLGAGRRIVDVIVSFRDRRTDVVEKQFVRVDISELFPFLVGKLAPYYGS